MLFVYDLLLFFNLFVFVIIYCYSYFFIIIYCNFNTVYYLLLLHTPHFVKVVVKVKASAPPHALGQWLG